MEPIRSFIRDDDYEVPAVLSCFRSYDVRGKLGESLTEPIATRIGRAFASALQAKLVVTGRDNRSSSAGLQRALHKGLMAGGVDVIDIGLCGTEEVYFATEHFGAGGGLMVTASHNPIEYNGIKMVGPGVRPISAETGLNDIKDLAETGNFSHCSPGQLRVGNSRGAYVARLATFLKPARRRPLKIVVNAGNGTAGPTFDALAAALDLPFHYLRINHNPDGAFPAGIPNPLLPENRAATAQAVRAYRADLGIAWDGDFDRCFFFDETGEFVPGEYIVAVLSRHFCKQETGSKIVYDPRVTFAIEDVVGKAGGVAIRSRVGHSHFKQAMRNYGAIYGGELSAHHYFRDFMHCDSGMIPWLLIADLLSQDELPLSSMMMALKNNFLSSGELNFKIAQQAEAMAHIEAAYKDQVIEPRAPLDGLSLNCGAWRANLRASNTEAYLRLNIETRGDALLLAQKIDDFRTLLAPFQSE